MGAPSPVACCMKQRAFRVVNWNLFISLSLLWASPSQVHSELENLFRLVLHGNRGFSKGAINAATKSQAIEFAGRGIRFNAIGAGIIDKPLHKPETHEFLQGLHPIHLKDWCLQTSRLLSQAKFMDGDSWRRSIPICHWPPARTALIGSRSKAHKHSICRKRWMQTNVRELACANPGRMRPMPLLWWVLTAIPYRTAAARASDWACSKAALVSASFLILLP